jgi:hypothetical protein
MKPSQAPLRPSIEGASLPTSALHLNQPRLRALPSRRSHDLRTDPKRDRGFGEAFVQRAQRRPQFRRDRHMERVTRPQSQFGLIGKSRRGLEVFARDRCNRQ